MKIDTRRLLPLVTVVALGLAVAVPVFGQQKSATLAPRG